MTVSTKQLCIKMLGGVVLLLLLLCGGMLLRGHFLISRIFYWVVLAAIFFYAGKIERQPLLLYKDKRYSFLKAFAMGICLYLIICGGNVFITWGLSKLELSGGLNSIDKVTGLALKETPLLMIFTCITAGVTEELLMRGYVQSRLERLLGRAWAGIIVSALIFGLLHIGYGTLLNIVGAFWTGLIFSIFYHKYRNIKVLIVVHILIDLIAVMG